MERIKIDNHKLMYHPERVSSWLEGNVIYPIYAEITPSGICNHRCTFCAEDFMDYQHRFLNTDILKTRLTEMAGLGLKSIMYAGEGEPLLHKNIGDIVVATKEAGIDVAFTTNSVALTPKFINQALEHISWIKTSIAAGTPETYAKIHRTKPEDFQKVITNLTNAVKIRNEHHFTCVLGAQIMLLPENIYEVETLAKISKEIGLDYLVVKPYSQHPMTISHKYEDTNYHTHLDLGEKLKKYNSANFKIIFRENQFLSLEEKDRGYEHCYGLPFWAYIDAGGNVWGCSVYLSDDRFRYGNIYENTFDKIWKGERRLNHLRWVENELDAAECRRGCRMHQCNKYLWWLRHLPEDETREHLRDLYINVEKIKESGESLDPVSFI